MSQDFKKVREEFALKKSKDRLLLSVKKRISTTMIGALSDMEKFLGDYLENNPELHEKIRSAILDRGNYQIRLFEIDLSDYQIKYNKHDLCNIILPVKKKED